MFVIGIREDYMIQNDITAKMHELMKTKDSDLQNYRVLVGEFQRQVKKELTDNDVLDVLKKLKKSELMRLSKAGEEKSSFLEVLNLWLPAEITEDEIRKFIKENIDFGTFKNKMQAVGVVTKHFGKAADGTLVKNIVLSI